MLLKHDILDGIRKGAITLAFRRWRRPTVKAGGTLLTSIGQLAIEAVDLVRLEDITPRHARAAGYPNLATLRSELGRRTEGEIYKVRLSLAGPDPRIALRDELPDETELDAILGRLTRMDSRNGSGPWTRRCLAIIDAKPAALAATLARECGMEKALFKVRVRRLKALGLTESLTIGYRLSPRGRTVLERFSL